MKVDHRNGDGLDNRKANLRVATDLQNSQNRASLPDSSSRYKGVHWDARDKCWRACIEHKGRGEHLGRFATEVEAALAYDRRAVELHGEFARLNIAAA